MENRFGHSSQLDQEQKIREGPDKLMGQQTRTASAPPLIEPLPASSTKWGIQPLSGGPFSGPGIDLQDAPCADDWYPRHVRFSGSPQTIPPQIPLGLSPFHHSPFYVSPRFAPTFIPPSGASNSPSLLPFRDSPGGPAHGWVGSAWTELHESRAKETMTAMQKPGRRLGSSFKDSWWPFYGDANWKDGEGKTHLMREAMGGRAIFVMALLSKHDVDVNLTDNEGRTALMLAAEEGHGEVMKLLLDAPSIDINATDHQGSSALLLASKSGDAGAFGLLLDTPGIDVNLANRGGQTALMNAMGKGFLGEKWLRLVERLLKTPGIDVNSSSTEGETALGLASQGTSGIRVVQLLLAVPGIKVDKANKKGATPLMMASMHDDDAIVELLLGAPGVDVNQADEMGMTALMYASCHWKGPRKTAKLLLGAPGIEVYVDGMTASDYMRSCEHQ